MPSTIRSTSTTAVVARVPYLNCTPFFRGLTLPERYETADLVPKALEERAKFGEVTAGPLPLAAFLRLEDTFERLGRLGIAVRGRVHSVMLFSRRPIRQLGGSTIAVTPETSTSSCLLRLLLEQRYELTGIRYEPAPQPDADAMVLIGNEALRFQQENRLYPFEVDLAFEWWLWQHLPFVFAVWAIRKDVEPAERKALELQVARALSLNMAQTDVIAQEAAERLAVPAQELRAYLENFVYRFGAFEEEGIERFRQLVHEHHLL